MLKETFENLLPPGHTRQPKSGFEIPISRWLRTDLRFLVDRYLSEERIRDQGIFDADVVQDLVRSHRKPKPTPPGCSGTSSCSNNGMNPIFPAPALRDGHINGSTFGQQTMMNGEKGTTKYAKGAKR